MVIVFFFFQAEDGIRDIGVTGVQTCALPIYDEGEQQQRAGDREQARDEQHQAHPRRGSTVPKTRGETRMPSSSKRSVNRGRTPVGTGLPRNRPAASTPAE